MRIDELFDSGEPEYYTGASLFTATTKFNNGTELDLVARKLQGVWVVDFSVGASTTTTKAGNEFEVFGAVMNAMLFMADHYKPQMLYFSATEASRSSLYSRMVKRLGAGMNILVMPYGGDTNFFLYKRIPDIKSRVLRTDDRARYSFPIFDKTCIVGVMENGDIEFDPTLIAFLKDGPLDVITYIKNVISPVVPNPENAQAFDLATGQVLGKLA